MVSLYQTTDCVMPASQHCAIRLIAVTERYLPWTVIVNWKLIGVPAHAGAEALIMYWPNAHFTASIRTVIR